MRWLSQLRVRCAGREIRRLMLVGRLCQAGQARLVSCRLTSFDHFIYFLFFRAAALICVVHCTTTCLVCMLARTPLLLFSQTRLLAG